MLVLLLVNMLLYSTFLYLLFRCLIKDGFLSSIGTLIVIFGGREAAEFIPNFHPRVFGLVLFMALLVLLLSKFKGSNRAKVIPNVVLSTILFVALTMTHLVDALVFVIILISTYVLGRFNKKNLIELPVVALFTIIVLTWLTYYAISTDTNLVSVINSSIRGMFSGQIVSSYFVNVTGSYFGAVGTAIWVTFIRYFWLVLTLVPGSIIALLYLFKIKRLSQIDQVLVGAVAGIAIFVVLTLVENGLIEGFRSLFYLPLIVVPIMLGFFSMRGNFVRRFVPAILVVIVLALCLPSFLVDNDRVGVAAMYPQEITASTFLGSHYGNGESLNIVGDSSTVRQILFDLPEANYEGFLSFAIYLDDNQALSELELLFKDFESPGSSYKNSLFLYRDV